MKHELTLMATMVLLCIGSSASAADAKAAELKATTLCAGCHGPNGVSTNPLWPNLAGQKDQYMAKTMREYKSGQRQDASMTALAQTLSEKEIDDLAAYYSRLPAGS